MNKMPAFAGRMAHVVFFVAITLLTFFGQSGIGRAAGPASDVTLSLSYGPSTVALYGTTVATYTITNTSSVSVADDIAFSDTLTIGLEIAAAPNATTTCSGRSVPPTLTASGGGGTLSFSGGSLPANNSCTITFNIKGLAVGSHVNTTSSLSSSLGFTSAASATLTVDSARPIFSKALSATSVSPNGTSTMTYTIDNTPYGGVITGVGFSETLPTGVQIASPSNTATTCTGGSLTGAAGSSSISLAGVFFTSAVSCTVTVDIQGTDSGDYTLTSGQLGSSLGNLGVASANLTVETPSASAPTLTKTFSGDPVAPGGTVTLGFNLYNSNVDFAAGSIAFTDDLDAMLSGATLVSDVTDPCGSGSSISGAGTGTISFAGGSLASRTNCNFSVTVQIPSGAAGGTYTNTTSTVSATVNGSPVTSSAASDTLQVSDGAPLELAMVWTSVDAGDPTTATITLTNSNSTYAASSAAFRLRVSDPFPEDPGATLPPSPDSCGGTMFYQTVSGVPYYIYINGAVAANSSCTITLSGLVVPSSTASGVYTQTAVENSATINGQTLTGNDASANLTVTAGASPLSITKSFDQSAAGVGDTVGMTLRLSNSSETSNATNISFTDDLDTFHSGATLSSVDSNGCGGSVSGVGTGSLGYSGGSVSTGASCDVKVSITLGTATGAQTNTTSDLTASLGGGSAAVQNGTAASASITVNTTSPITASVEFIDDPVVAGGTVTARYTITNPNSAPHSIADIGFTHGYSSVLSGLAATAVTPATLPCGPISSAGGTVTFQLSSGALDPGASCSFDVTLAVPAGAADGSYRIPTSAITYIADSPLSIEKVADTLIVGVSGEGSASLELTKSFDSSYVLAGGSAGLTLTLKNLGSEAATGITFTDDLSGFLSGTTFGTATSNTCGGTLTGESGTLLTLASGSLASGATCSIQIPVDFGAGVALGTYTNTTSDVGGTTASGAVGGPADTASIEVRSASVPTFSKSISPSTANTNSSVVMTYTISNPPGGITRTNLAFTDDVADDITGSAATDLTKTGVCGAGSSLSGTSLITFTGGSLAPGASCTFTATVSIATPLPGIYSSSTSSLTDNGLVVAAGVSDTVTVNPLPPTFSKVFAPDSMVQGDTSTLTFTIDASTIIDNVSGLSFTDNLPTGVVMAATPNASTTCTGGTLTAASGAGTISYSGGTVTAGSTCTVSVDVTSVSIGVYVNTSGVLSSDFGPGGTASDTLSVTAAPIPGFAKAFSPSSIAEGATSTLTFSINNSTALIPATSLDFTDNLPASITVASTPNASTTCTGGTLTAASGAGSISYSGGTVSAGGTCTVSVDVLAVSGTNAANTSGDLTSSLGNSGTASATLSITPAPAPGFAKAFSPSSIAEGATSTLTFSIDNTGALIPASSLSFTDNLPASITVATVPNASTTCTGGTLTAASGAGSISYSGGTVSAGGTCTVSVDVLAVSGVDAANTSSDLTSSIGNSGTASATLSITPAPAPGFAKAFSPRSIAEGATSTLTFSIDNTGALIPASSLDFTDALPASITVATVPNASTTCTGGTLTAVSGAGSISYSGGTVSAGGTCTVSVDVLAVSGTNAANTSGDLTSSLGNSGTANATLSITPAPAPGFAKAFSPSSIAEGATSTLTFSIDNTGALIPASSLSFTDNLPASITVATVPNASTTCTGGTLTAASGAGSISYSGGTVSAGGTCTVSVDVLAVSGVDAANTSGDLTSSIGNSGTASATLSITPAPVLSVSKSFSPSTITQGNTSTLTINVENTSLVDATNIDLSDAFPTGMEVANPASVTETCNGTIAATAGNTTVSYDNGSLAAGESCSISVDVTSVTLGAAVNTTSDITSSLGNSGTASATLTVNAPPAPGFTKNFSPDRLFQGDTSVLTFTIDNTSSYIDATDLAFVDSFPTGMTIAATPDLSTTCTGAVITATSGSGQIEMTSGTVAADNSCTVQVTVVAMTAGSADNVSGDLTSSLGNSGTASATLNVVTPGAPGFAKAFAPDSIVQGDVSTLTFTIDNSGALVSATALDFSDSFPSGMTVAATPNASSTCTGGTVTASAGTSSVSYSGGTVDAGAICEISVDVTSATVGDAANTSGDLTSSLGNSGTASATLSVTAAGAPGFAKAFAPDSIVQGDVSTLTFTIDNSGALVAATALDFSDSFPSGMTVAATPNASSTCSGGTVTATANADTINFTGWTVAAGASCEVSVDVTSATVGDAVNVSDDLTSSLGNSGTASATLSVTAAGAPGFAKAFAPDSIVQGDVSTLTFTIDNSAALVAATALDFSDSFPSGMTVAATPNGSSTCSGGTLTAAASADTISFSGGTLAAGASCEISVDVTSATVGDAANTSGDLTSSLGNSGTASATLSVTAAGAPGFAKVFAPDSIVQGDVSTLTFTIDNSGALVAATALDFSDSFPSGMTVAATPNGSSTCSGGTLTAGASADTISFSGGTLAAGASCEISVDVTSATVGDAANTSGDLTSSLGNSGTASATLSVTAAGAPGFAKVFAPDSIVQGDVSTLTFTIDNSAALVAATALDFSDSFPSGMTVAATPNATSTCSGGTLTAESNATSFGYTDGTLAAGASCEITVGVTVAIAGAYENETGDLTSSLGNSGTASATLSVTAADVPVFAKAFTPDSIVQGDVSTLTFTIDNSAALVAATDLDFTDSFPSGMVIATEPNATSTCTDGTLTAEADAVSFAYTGGTLTAGETCEITVDVTAAIAGDYDNESGDLTSSLGNSGTAAATLSVTATGAPDFSKAFSPDSIVQGDVSTLTFTIDNSAALVAATELDFTDSFPSGMTVAATPNATSTCSGGTIAAVAEAAVFGYSGGSVDAGSTCELSVDVTASVVDDYDNESGDLTSSLGNSGTASARLSVTTAGAPVMTQRFNPETIAQGGTSTLIVTIDNSANFIEVGGLAFNGIFPDNLKIANPTGADSTCGGTLNAVSGDTSFSFSAGTVGAEGSCEIRLNVTSVAVGGLASKLSPLSTDAGTSPAPADVEVTVVVNTNAYVTFVQETTEDGSFGFTSPEALLNFTIATASGTGSVGPIEIPSGNYTVKQSRPSGVGNESISCSDDDSTVNVTGGEINLVLGDFESVTCTISSVATLQKTVDTIHNFLQRRNNLLLSNQPSRSRRLQRLNSGGTGGQQLSFATGDIMSMSPLEFDLMSIGSGNYHVATSTHRMRTAQAMALLAHNPDLETMYVKNTRWDVWFEGFYNEFSGTQGAGGHFALGYFGADYVVSKDLLIGALIQFDSMRDASTVTSSTVEGQGWMAGPYITARLAPNLIFDGRLAMGQSTNDISPFNTYTDTFETERLLANASLTGQYELKNNWMMSPNVSLSYIRENQQAYVDSLGVPIPGQKVSLGQLRLGPNFSRRFEMLGGDVWEPFFTFDAIYNFSDASGASLSANATTESDGLRGRLEGGFNYTNREGLQFSMTANYDGIGQNDFESYGAGFKLTIPLQ